MKLLPNAKAMLATASGMALWLAFSDQAIAAPRCVSFEVALAPVAAADREPAGLAANPSCGKGGAPRVVDGVMHILARHIDLYIDKPVVSGAQSASPAVDNWVAANLGTHDGSAPCETVCVATPYQYGAYYSLCMAGGDGRACFGNEIFFNWDGWPTVGYRGRAFDTGLDGAHIRDIGIARRKERGTTLFCATGLNRSAEFTRMFSVEACYQPDR